MTTEALAVPTPQLSVEMLIAKGIEHGVTVEALQQLLDMRERLKGEQAREAFFEALSGFQAECPVIPKTKTVGGGSYSYRYAPLEAIVAAVSPILRTHGLSYRFDTRFDADPPAQTVVCTVYHVQGHSESSEFRTPVDQGARMNDMQKSASAQTYAKRYAFCNALGILTGDEDNDGQGTRGPDVGSGVRDHRRVGTAGDARAAVQPVAASGAGGLRVNPEAATSAGSGDRHGQASRERPVEPPPPAPRGRNLVPIRRAQGAQDSDQGNPDFSSVSPHDDAAPAETPASPASDVVAAARKKAAEDAQVAANDMLTEECIALASTIELHDRVSRGQEEPDEETMRAYAIGRCDNWLSRTSESKTWSVRLYNEPRARPSHLEALRRILQHHVSKIEKATADRWAKADHNDFA